MDIRPPDFFNRGPTPLARLVFFAALAIAFMLADYRFKYLDTVRQSLTVIVYPLQQAALTPARLFERFSEFFASQTQLQSENAAIRLQLLSQADQIQRLRLLEAQFANLQKLLGARQHAAYNSILVEVLYNARSPFSRKVIVDKGVQDGVRAGQAVIDAAGVIGQVTAVYPFTSEITLTTEKGQAVPVMVLRNGMRAILFGGGQDNSMELPFIPANADIRNADVLVTSGIDGTYPEGLEVATVTNIETNANVVFSKIICTPIAGVAKHKHMLVLAHSAPVAIPRPDDELEAKPRAEKSAKPVKPGKRKREE